MRVIEIECVTLSSATTLPQTAAVNWVLHLCDVLCQCALLNQD